MSRPIPITATAAPVSERIEYGDPILIELSLSHALDGQIRLTAFATEPHSWNAEVWTVRLVQVKRLPDDTPLQPRAPQVSPPERFGGPTYHDIDPGNTFTLIHDAGKWDIPGDWAPGEYELVFSISNLTIDPYFQLVVYSTPTIITIESIPEQETGGDR